MKEKSDRRSRKILAPLATLVVAGAIAVGSGASFTAQTTNPNNMYATGTLTMSNSRDGEAIFNIKEFEVLALLFRTPGAVVARERFMEEVWDEHWFGSTKTLDVTIGRLRSKLEAAEADVVITAVRGVGYRLDPPDA